MCIRPIEELDQFKQTLEHAGMEYSVIENPEVDYLAVLYDKFNEKSGTKYTFCQYFQKPLEDNRLMTKLIEAGFPELHAVSVTQNDTDKRYAAISFANEMIRNLPKPAFLMGKSGFGKTYCATYIAYKLLSERKINSCLFLPAPNVTKKMINGEWIFDFDEKADFIVIDDLGTETKVLNINNPQHDLQGIIYDFTVNKRINKNKPVLITSNISDLEELELRYDKRFINKFIRHGIMHGLEEKYIDGKQKDLI